MRMLKEVLASDLDSAEKSKIVAGHVIRMGDTQLRSVLIQMGSPYSRIVVGTGQRGANLPNTEANWAIARRCKEILPEVTDVYDHGNRIRVVTRR